jgi:hypothetical protein
VGVQEPASSATTLHEIRSLLTSRHPLIVVESVEEERAVGLLSEAAEQAGLQLFEWSVTTGLRRKDQRHAFHRTDDPLTLLKHIGGLTVEGAYLLKDFSVYLESPELRRQLRELASQWSGRRSSLVILGETVELPPELAREAVFLRLQLPGPAELHDVVSEVLESFRGRQSVRVELTPASLSDLVRSLRGLTLKQARQVVSFCVLSDGRLSAEDVETALCRKGELIRNQGLLEYYPAASNAYALGGFAKLKGWLERARVGFTEDAQRLNLRPPRGILVLGVQGCGKSLAAKFVAREWGLPLLRLDAGRLYDRYVGESERNFRRAVGQAESMAPVVLWVDELEKAISGSGGSESDGGVGQRITGAFLTWLQEHSGNVFVAATANDVSQLPPELLRKGRFDEIFFVDLPDLSERMEIFRIHLALRNQDPECFDLEGLCKVTEGFSGAEIEQAVIASLYRCLHEKRTLTSSVLVEECTCAVPLSVSRREEIESLRRWARDRFVSVS